MPLRVGVVSAGGIVGLAVGGGDPVAFFRNVGFFLRGGCVADFAPFGTDETAGDAVCEEQRTDDDNDNSDAVPNFFVITFNDGLF